MLLLFNNYLDNSTIENKKGESLMQKFLAKLIKFVPKHNIWDKF